MVLLLLMDAIVLDAFSAVRAVTSLESEEGLFLVDGGLVVDDFVELVVETAVLELQLIDDLLELFLVVAGLVQQSPELGQVALQEKQFLVLD